MLPDPDPFSLAPCSLCQSGMVLPIEQRDVAI